MIIGILLACSFTLSVILTPLAGALAIRFGIVDRPDNVRKKHQRITPYFGGVAIYLGFIIVLCSAALATWFGLKGFRYFLLPGPINFRFLLWFCVGATIIVCLGILDDAKDLNFRIKFVVQLLVAIGIVYAGNLELTIINLPFYGEFEFGDFGFMFSVIWIVGVSNSINLMDGLDGLAGGISFIVLSTISFLAIQNNDMFALLISITLQGSVLGFLVYNYPPARIFMGDAGALVIGYVLSVISLTGFKSATFVSFLLPVMILAIPIFDTFFAIIRRTLNGAGWGNADSSHLHHQLKKRTSEKRAVQLIYGLTFAFALTSIIYNINSMGGLIFLFVDLILFGVVAYRIDLVGFKTKDTSALHRMKR